MTGGIIVVSCMCIAAGAYALLRGKLPPPFVGVAGFNIVPPPRSVARRWGLGLLLFGAVLGALALINLSMPRGL